MKSQEQRIEDAARAMCSDWSRVSVHIQEDWRKRARAALEAATRKKHAKSRNEMTLSFPKHEEG